MDKSEYNINILDYGLQLNELVNQGVKFIPIEDHIKLLDAYIEMNELLDKSHENFCKVAEVLGVKVK